MKIGQPVRVTMRNGEIKYFQTDMYNLPSVLGKLNMIDVAGIEYGEAVINKGPAEFRPSGIEYTYSKSEGVYHMSIYDKHDQRVATCKYAPTVLQQAAVNLLQQTTYRFIDLQGDHDELQHRMDGLDK